MSTRNPQTVVVDVVRDGSVAANSVPVRVAGAPFSFQSIAPAAVITIEGSVDGHSWTTLTDLENNALSTVQSVSEEVKERPEYVRFTLTAGGDGTLYRVAFHIRKEQH